MIFSLFPILYFLLVFFFFFFNDTATTEIYTLSLHDALPISSTPGSGWPYGLRGPTEITATAGPTAPRNAGVLDVREPWCATLRTVAAIGAPEATSACSRAASMSDVSRNDASPYSTRSTIASSFRLRRETRLAGARRPPPPPPTPRAAAGAPGALVPAPPPTRRRGRAPAAPPP